MGLNDPQWGRKKGNSGPPDLDELWRNVNKKLNSLLNARVAEGEVKGRTAVKSLPVANHFTFEAALVLLLECSC
ncbi:MAG: hypothetical protein JW384_01481 [Nitrosomonadaceae bacterium]|nr:hypothetical protein [Nitrosomonadaceae bacterium]